MSLQASDIYIQPLTPVLLSVCVCVCLCRTVSWGLSSICASFCTCASQYLVTMGNCAWWSGDVWAPCSLICVSVSEAPTDSSLMSCQCHTSVSISIICMQSVSLAPLWFTFPLSESLPLFVSLVITHCLLSGISLHSRLSLLSLLNTFTYPMSLSLVAFTLSVDLFIPSSLGTVNTVN